MFPTEQHVNVLSALGYYSGAKVDRWTPQLADALGQLTQKELGYRIERRLTADDTLPRSLIAQGGKLILASEASKAKTPPVEAPKPPKPSKPETNFVADDSTKKDDEK